MTELTPEQKVQCVMELKNTLEKLAAQHADALESLAPKVRKRVELLRNIQSQQDKLEAKFIAERAALEAKYQKIYEPFYSKRYEIVTGASEVEGVTQGGNERTDGQKGKGVPDFWLNAMMNNEILAQEIQKRDEEALKYLENIKWCRIDGTKGFKIEFAFDTNPFFKNAVLTKTYHMIDEDELILEKATGTEIEWYPEKCLTQLLQKKSKKSSKDTRPIKETKDCDSFFNFFSPPRIPDNEEEIDEYTAQQLQNQIEHDYNIGSTIWDKIIPHAVSWFTRGADKDGLFLSDDENNNDDDAEDEEGE